MTKKEVIMTALTQLAESIDNRAHTTRIERVLEENVEQTHQQERMQRWIFQLADQAGMKLKYE